MKKYHIFHFLALLVCFSAFSKSIDQTEPIDGSQRNRITASSTSSGGGGGFVTNGNNIVSGNNDFTGTNTFDAVQYFNNDIVMTNAGATSVIFTSALKLVTGAVTLEEDLNTGTQTFQFKKNGVAIATFPGAIMSDSGSTGTIDGNLRNLKDVNASINFNWAGNTITNYGSIFVGTNMFGNGTLNLNTNTATAGDFTIIARQQPGHTASYMALESDNGDTKYQFGTHSLGGQVLFDSADIYYQTYGTFTGIIYRYRNGSQYENFNGTTIAWPVNASMGVNSSSTITINGIAISIPNGINIGTGQLQIPATGTLTNNSSFTTLNTLTSSNSVVAFISGPSASTITNTSGSFVQNTLTTSNLVVTTTSGTGVVNFGTNLTAQIIATSNLSTQALMVFRTNTLTAPLPVVNAIYTNTSQRLWISCSVRLTSSVTAGSSAALWQVTGTQTNYQGRATAEAGLTGVTTNSCFGYINPNALYMITNTDAAGGAATLVPGEFVHSFQ